MHITDSHLLADPAQTMLNINTDRCFHTVLEDVRRQHWLPDLVLHTGDLAQEAHATTYHRLREYLQELKAPCYVLPGNHDDTDLMERYLARENIHYVSHILLEKWQVITLNSTKPEQPGGRLSLAQLTYIENMLARYPERHALIAMHHHCVPTGSSWLDTMLIENAGAFWAILQRHDQIRCVLYGHVHQEQDFWHNGIRMLATPSTCFQFKPLSDRFAIDVLPSGYRWLSLYDDGRIDTEVKRLAKLPAGLAIDSTGY